MVAAPALLIAAAAQPTVAELQKSLDDQTAAVARLTEELAVSRSLANKLHLAVAEMHADVNKARAAIADGHEGLVVATLEHIAGDASTMQLVAASASADARRIEARHAEENDALNRDVVVPLQEKHAPAPHFVLVIDPVGAQAVRQGFDWREFVLSDRSQVAGGTFALCLALFASMGSV